MEKINNAIIIHGPGRSGTTLFSNILSLHKDLYWISGYTNKYPGLPVLSLANNFQQIKSIEKLTRNKGKFPRPAEAYNFWNHFFKEFESVHGAPEKSEVSRALQTLHKIKSYSSGHRFVTKLTGNSRVQFLHRLFENPTILWIDRRPEAVVMSYYKQRWGYKSRPDKFESLPKLQLIEVYSERYKGYQLEKQKLKQFKFFQLFYEDLISDPIAFFSEVCQKTDLPIYKGFKETILNWEIYGGSNEAYKKNLSEEELNYLEAKLFEESEELGYRS
jgi:hypothetical protein